MENKVLKYRKLGFAIEVDLHYKDYMVRANIFLHQKNDDDMNTYDVTLELKRKDISKWDVMEEIVFRITSCNINMAVYNMIMDKFAEGYFKPFMKSYEYELDCFDRGNEMFEEERSVVIDKELPFIAK